MGEVAVSSEVFGVMRLEREAEKSEEVCGVLKQAGGSTELTNMWEKFLKRRMLRVLLVEADDSTRQIIAALLRKCSYKVAAVSDGLKAWEVLKGRPHNIDLILTEVDLPAISGFALLTLIMEHEICKNIPVIMMSSHDSISTVYKCMLRGAADYLVKPIRRNELRNLWQHVWRKQNSMNGFNGPQDESVAQPKIEVTSENNTASNHSSGDIACIQRNKELIEKGSDAQSSCTKPDLEAECMTIEDQEEHAQSKCNRAYVSKEKVQENGFFFNLGWKEIMQDNNAIGISQNGDTVTTLGRDSVPACHASRAGNLSGTCDNNDARVTSYREEATDLTTTFHTHPIYDQRVSLSISGTRKIAPSPQLDLSFRRSESNSVENEVAEERNTLVHSDASAFKRYSNRQFQTSPTAGKQQMECRMDSEKNISNMGIGYNSETSVPGWLRSVSPATMHSKESDIATSQLQQPVFPIAVPVKGMRFNDICQAYGSVLPPVFYTQSSSVAHKEPSFPASVVYQSNIKDHNSPKLYKPQGENARNGNEVTMHRQDDRMESCENQGEHASGPATDQSACSGFCNGAFSHLNNFAYGSNCGSDSNADQVPAVVTGSESKTEDLTKYGFSNRSVQREVALSKFRMKRKERCYEKKVRYESRKKLAEQRPRVKGQFVRQVQPDLHTVEKNAGSHDG